jgi:CHAD domain-containing protein
MLNKYTFIRDNEPDNKNEVLKNIFKKSEKYLSEQAEKFKKDVFSEITEDIENWLDERLDNVTHRNFEYLEQLLFGGLTYVPEDKKKAIEHYLTGIGFTAEKFREKLFKEHREEILKSIEYNVIYDSLEAAFNHYSLSNYAFSDIRKNYPQSDIIRGFARYMINQMPFNEFMESEIHESIKKARQELQNLRIEAKKLKEILDNYDEA